MTSNLKQGKYCVWNETTQCMNQLAMKPCGGIPYFSRNIFVHVWVGPFTISLDS